ncbi:putative phage tail protein [Bacillus sp. JJ722]|uniref:putative phage tail protein n=1 Tax=Bacillus sp. JJ722 TaxID=3122973 RepID=UPI002FFE74DD
MQELKRKLYDLLPRYYDESPEVEAIMHASAVELDEARRKARDLLDQFFVRTATWGLADWERVLALPPAPHSDVEFRRQRILAKLAGNAPATLRYMTDLINVYVPKRDAEIIEHNSEYRFEAVVPLADDNPIDTGEIYHAINEVKPAHLGFDLVGELRDVITVTGREYSFDVPYLICNEFSTDDAQGIGIKDKATVIAREYGFEVPYLVCGEFYAGEEWR